MNTPFVRIIRHWIPLAVVLSAVVFIIYAVIQQDIRMDANDPQIQMAEDLATTLNDGGKPAVSGHIDIAHSLAPFTILYDTNGNIISTNAYLNSSKPSVPKGALTSHKDTDIQGENRITWQPQEQVRLATVIVAYNKGFVVVGRNMRETEIRENQQFQIIFFGWVVSLIATLSAIAFMEIVMKKK
jgi:hypothetical protein